MRRHETPPVYDWSQPSEYTEDEFDDDFDPIEYHQVRHLVERALRRGDHPRAARILENVREARTERAIRKRMIEVLHDAGGSLGIESLMNRVVETEGIDSMNATLCLAYIMQDEGSMKIHIPDDQEAIIVELIRKRRR